MDDLSIRDNSDLLRRIPFVKGSQVVWDDNVKRYKPSSAAFNNTTGSNSMSIVLAEKLEKGRKPSDVVMGYDNNCLISFKARVARENNQRIIHDALPDEPAHGSVIGEKSKKVKRALAKASVWVVEPEIGK